MSIHRKKNGVGFCATKGCKHLMSVRIEVKVKRANGKYLTTKRFNLCEDCVWKLLNDVDFEVLN